MDTGASKDPFVPVLAQAALIIIDERSMIRAKELDCISAALRIIGFQGVLLVVGNDAQLGPVMKGANIITFIANHVTSSQPYASSLCHHVTLRQNMRMSGDHEFMAACLKIGYGVWEHATPFAADWSQIISLPVSLFPAVPATTDEILRSRRWVHPTMFSSSPHVPFSSQQDQNIIIKTIFLSI